MKILDLPLKKKWYEMIESGEKTEEYREYKDYWRKRLIDMDTLRPKPYTHVRFRYGYTKRTMLFKIDCITVGVGNPDWGAPEYPVFIIKFHKLNYMKQYTDLTQSRRLAEILPLESANMYYHPYPNDEDWYDIPNIGNADLRYNQLPCWSLAALLDVLPYSQLSKDKLGGNKEGWIVSAYPDNCRYDSCWHDNPIDCCVEIILKLHELKLI